MRLSGKTRPSLVMVVAVLALTGAVAATAVAGPDAFTSGALTKKKVKKIAKKQANKQITARVLAAEVAGGCNEVTGGSGDLTVDASGSECNVTFPRNVNKCAITLGTLLDFPGGGETTYRKESNTVVQVSRRDSAGGTPTAGAFSIAAICPKS